MLSAWLNQTIASAALPDPAHAFDQSQFSYQSPVEDTSRIWNRNGGIVNPQQVTTLILFSCRNKHVFLSMLRMQKCKVRWPPHQAD